jgi:hypothetical protein
MLIDGKYLLFDLDPVERSLAEGNKETVQFAEPFAAPAYLAVADEHRGLVPGLPLDLDAYIQRVNRLCARYETALEVRFYAHYGEAFDGRTLRRFPEARSLVVNSLQRAVHLEEIASLSHLRHLGLGVLDMKDQRLLSALPVERLEYLALEEMGTKALDLKPLENAHRLRHLRILAPYKKNIEALGSLDELEIFSFSPVKTVALDFLAGMIGLRALKLVLGGTGGLPDFALPRLADLAVTQVRGFVDFGSLERFPALERVLVQDQPHLKRVACGTANKRLAHLWFWNCPMLEAIEGFSSLPSARSLRAFRTGLDVGVLAVPPSLTHLSVHTTRMRDAPAEHAAIDRLGLIDEAHPDAMFFYK